MSATTAGPEASPFQQGLQAHMGPDRLGVEKLWQADEFEGLVLRFALGTLINLAARLHQLWLHSDNFMGGGGMTHTHKFLEPSTS